MASLDNAKHGLAYSSGTGATATVLQLLGSGDHIVASNAVYGGTYVLIAEIASHQGIQFDFVDGTDVDSVKNAVKKNTRVSDRAPCVPLQI